MPGCSRAATTSEPPCRAPRRPPSARPWRGRSAAGSAPTGPSSRPSSRSSPSRAIRSPRSTCRSGASSASSAGIALGSSSSDVGGANALTVALLIGAGLIAGLLIRIGGEPNSQVAVSALLVLAVATGAGAFGLERLWETAIGAAVTVVLAPFLWPPDPVHELERRLAAVATRVADDIALTVALVGAPADAAARHLADVVEHTREATRLVDALGTAGRGCASTRAGATPRSACGGSCRASASPATWRTARADWRATSPGWPRARTWRTPGRRRRSRPRPPARRCVATVRAALADAPTGGDRLRAEAALDRWRDLDTSAVAVVLRRDLRTLLEDAIPVAAAAARVP